MNDSSVSLINSTDWVESFLYACILTCIIFIITGLFVLFFYRYRRIKIKKIKAQYEEEIQLLIFSILFDKKKIKDVLNQKEFQQKFRNRTYKKQLLRILVTLHKSYSGEHALILEKIYFQSGLYLISLKKLNTGNWVQRCQAIRDLSEMKATNTTTIIEKHCYSKNKTLQLEALLGMVKLKGMEIIIFLQNFEFPINDWIQANIIQSLKASAINTDSLSLLLQSENESVVVLGIRLVEFFKNYEALDRVNDFYLHSKSEMVKNQAYKILSALNYV